MCIEGDCLSIVQLLNESTSKSSRCIQKVIQNCRELVKSSKNISILHVPQTSNKAVHHMTAIAVRDHISTDWNASHIMGELDSVVALESCNQMLSFNDK